jgi:hypothetical protein
MPFDVFHCKSFLTIRQCRVALLQHIYATSTWPFAIESIVAYSNGEIGMNKNSDNNKLNELALFVGIASLLLTAGQVLPPVSDGALLRAMVLGQMLNLIAIALLIAIICDKLSSKR